MKNWNRDREHEILLSSAGVLDQCVIFEALVKTFSLEETNKMWLWSLFYGDWLSFFRKLDFYFISAAFQCAWMCGFRFLCSSFFNARSIINESNRSEKSSVHSLLLLLLLLFFTFYSNAISHRIFVGQHPCLHNIL